MNIFDILTMIGGLCLFLFGMNIMSASLERSAGGKLRGILGKLTTGRMAGLATGAGVTAVIQSSSATTVMVVGFVNSGLLTLRQAINVIMGANIGTTVTAWILSLAGIDSENFFVRMLNPASFSPLLALAGIIMFMMCKSARKKDIGMILLGFSTLMFGMETMADAVSGLAKIPEFTQILLVFSNPIFGVLAGALLTALIQSSSASVGILQALASTGSVTVGSAIPIIMGQNIGTCVTALISSVGTNRNAKRAAAVHLSFNVIGTVVWIAVYMAVRALFEMPILASSIDGFGIAVIHTSFNILCTALLLPASSLLEKIVCRIIPDKASEENITEIDERLMNAPAVAIERCKVITETMATVSMHALRASLQVISDYDNDLADRIREDEAAADHYEDILGTYLVKLGSTHTLSGADKTESVKLLHMIGDFERISDHAVNILEAAEEMQKKQLSFSEQASKELNVIIKAVNEISDLATTSFLDCDVKSASLVEPLEQVIDILKDQLRSRHILRMQRGECTIETGFVWSDFLTDLERVADHCSNIAGCVIEMTHNSLDLHGYLNNIKSSNSPEFQKEFAAYSQKFALVE